MTRKLPTPPPVGKRPPSPPPPPRPLRPAGGLPFGHPDHPWRATTEHCSKAGKIARKKSPWGRGPMVNTARAQAVHVEFAAKRGGLV